VLLAYLFVLLAMLLLETWLVYPAPPLSVGNWHPSGLKHEEVWFKSADGTRLHGWFVPHPKPQRAILYCHGNGEHVATNAELAARLRDQLQASVFLFDYRGYGNSSGRPDESGCIADGRAAQRWLAERMGIRPDQVVLIGRSLGGAVAVALAAEQGAAALILECTFPSLCAAAACHYPWLPVHWTMDNQYDSLARIRGYLGPLLQSHGTLDVIVPIDLGRELFEASPSSVKRWVEFPHLGHNSDWPKSYYTTLGVFLDLHVTPIAEAGLTRPVVEPMPD
jgi:pimeloyl-ACP methyl ester carboxylesterase